MLPRPQPSHETITVPLMTYEMLKWEVHALRTLLTVCIARVQVYTKTHPEAEPLERMLIDLKERMEAQHLEALLDPAKRNERPETTE